MTILLKIVSIPFDNTNQLDGLPNLEHGTFSWPCEKHNVPIFRSQTDIAYLLIVIAM